jgi:hypothetical protein
LRRGDDDRRQAHQSDVLPLSASLCLRSSGPRSSGHSLPRRSLAMRGQQDGSRHAAQRQFGRDREPAHRRDARPVPGARKPGRRINEARQPLVVVDE